MSIEFDLNIIPLPLLRLKFGSWVTISRILWFLRLLKSDRPIKKELKRAKECEELIYKKAKEGWCPIILVAHGMLNIFIEKNLTASGCLRVCKTKNGFFAITKLQIKK